MLLSFPPASPASAPMKSLWAYAKLQTVSYACKKTSKPITKRYAGQYAQFTWSFFWSHVGSAQCRLHSSWAYVRSSPCKNNFEWTPPLHLTERLSSICGQSSDSWRVFSYILFVGRANQVRDSWLCCGLGPLRRDYTPRTFLIWTLGGWSTLHLPVAGYSPLTGASHFENVG